MSVNLDLTEDSKPVKVNFKLPKDLADKFKLYVQAAKEEYPNCDDSKVLEAILNKHIKYDGKFKSWLAQHESESSDNEENKKDSNKVSSIKEKTETGSTGKDFASTMKSNS